MTIRKTVWLLDVDGVVNVDEDEGDEAWSAYLEGRASDGRRSWHIRWAVDLVARIKEINARDDAEVRRCSTWCGPPAENLGDLIGVRLRSAWDEAIAPGTGEVERAKWNAARTVLAAGDRLVWTDDRLLSVITERWPASRAFELHRADALLVNPDPWVGLRPEDVADIFRFIERGAVRLGEDRDAGAPPDAYLLP